MTARGGASTAAHNTTHPFLRSPREAETKSLTNARVELGETYPHPIIALSEGRERALAASERIKPDKTR
jgi:deoxyribodipyrimidine photolyase